MQFRHHWSQCSVKTFLWFITANTSFRRHKLRENARQRCCRKCVSGTFFPSEVQQIQTCQWRGERWSIEGKRASACRRLDEKKGKTFQRPQNNRETPSPPPLCFSSPPSATTPLPLESPHTRHFTDIWTHSNLFSRLDSNSSKVLSSESQTLTSCLKAPHGDQFGGFHQWENFSLTSSLPSAPSPAPRH